MRKEIVCLLALMLLLVSCATAPSGPPDNQLCLRELPDLAPPVHAQEPDFIETMGCFLSGKLGCAKTSETSATSTSANTSGPSNGSAR